MEYIVGWFEPTRGIRVIAFRFLRDAVDFTNYLVDYNYQKISFETVAVQLEFGRSEKAAIFYALN